MKSSFASTDLRGKKLYDVLPAEVAQEAVRLVERVLQTGEPHTFEYQLLADGDTREYHARLIPSGDDEVVALVHDVSELRQLEQQILHSQKMEAVGHLAGGVAHDFNNLLTAIMGYCQLGMRSRAPGDKSSTTLREIQRAAERGAGLCRQLLVFSGGQTAERRVVNLNDLVLNMGAMLRRLIGEDIELVTRPIPDLGLVKIDPGQLEQVLVNLVVNAREAMPGGGTLTVEMGNISVDDESAPRRYGAAPGEYVMLLVSDTGTGIPPEVRPHIFEPFITTKEPGRGAGLGLFTCYGIVSQNHGHISVQSEPGKGTTFEVYLPRVDEPHPFVAPRDESSSLPSGKETVLLVEDERMVREAVARVLRQQGYIVLEAAGGAEALKLAQGYGGQIIELLITDVVMPVMSGRELADRIRETRRSIKILYTSGYTGDTLGVIDLGERDTAFIGKPFTPSELARKVRAVL